MAKLKLSVEDKAKLAKEKADAKRKIAADAAKAKAKLLADKEANAREEDAKAAEANKAELAAIVERIKKGIDRSQAGIHEWADGTLEIAKAFYEARLKFKSNAKFGEWADGTGLKFNGHDRVALIGFGGEPEVAHEVLLRTDSRSLQLIWKEKRSKFKKPLSEAELARRDREAQKRLASASKTVINPDGTLVSMSVYVDDSPEDPYIPDSTETSLHAETRKFLGECYRNTEFEKKVSDYLKAADLSKEPDKAKGKLRDIIVAALKGVSIPPIAALA
ncbi:MAG: hypothetical protein WDN46_24105 [Methylocella sp.]